MRYVKKLKHYEYKGWLIKKHPNSFAERYSWTANMIDDHGYREEYYGFNSERECKKFVDRVKDQNGN